MSGIDRRGFLRFLGLAAAGATMPLDFDLERLLWVPGAKTIFLPPVVPVPDYLDWISLETLKLLKNKTKVFSFTNAGFQDFGSRYTRH